MVQKALTTDMLRRPTVDALLADAWLYAHREEVHIGALVDHFLVGGLVGYVSLEDECI